MGTISGNGYISTYTGDQIDAALGKAINPDTVATQNSANLITSGAVAKISASGDISVYVATTGNDTTGDGTQDNPYATPQKALDSLPKFLNGHSAYVYIAPGTYTGITTIFGFNGGQIQFGDISGAGTVALENLFIYNTDDVVLFVDTLSGGTTSTGKLYIEASNVFLSKALSIDGDSSYIGVYANFGTRLVTGYSMGITVSNCNIAILAMPGGAVNIYDTIAGSGNSTGLQSVGGLITFGAITLTATTLYIKASGGQILTGAGVNP